MATSVIEQKVNDILTRGVGTFVDSNGKFRAKLLAKANGTYAKDIVIKFGVDVTRPDIHIGHAVALRKLRALQDLGCKVVFLIGDFTTLIGDPTGKSKVRPEVDFATVAKNMETYLDQVDKVLLVDRDAGGKIKDSTRFSWIRNSEWYFGVTDISVEGASQKALTIKDEKTGQEVVVPGTSFLAKAALYENTRMQKTLLHHPTTFGVSFVNLLALLRHISYAQLIERDMFQTRIKAGEPLFVHELLYPVIQGTDSNVMADIYGSCDLEIGGTDQTFNMLMGRKIMETVGKEPQAVMAVELLVGLDGKEKMSKSLDNYVGVIDAPNDMYGKIMSVPDAAIPAYYELATFTPMDDVAAITERLKDANTNPRDLKMELARQIVAIYHGEEKARASEAAFVDTFQKGKLPGDITEHAVARGTLLGDALLAAHVVASKAECRRLVEEGAIIEWEGERVTDAKLAIDRPMTLKVGKRRFVKFTVQ